MLVFAKERRWGSRKEGSREAWAHTGVEAASLRVVVGMHSVRGLLGEPKLERG